MITPFFILATSFLVTFLILPIFIQFLRRRHFMDDPGGRKIHTVQTPAMGGLPIFIAFVFAILIWAPFEVLREIKYVLSALSLMFVVGFRDDLINLKALQKLMGQIAAALIIVAVCDIRLISFYGLFGIGDFPLWLSYALTVFTIVVITNAFNLIDGIDGLSGVVAIIASLFFGVWFYLNGGMGMAFIALAFVGALVAFLHFNWAPSKIFMGDTGSLLIGFYLSVMAISFLNLNHNLGLSAGNAEFAFSASIGTVIAVLIIPLADTLRVFVKRALKGKSPMHPDRTHVHHILLRLGCNHSQATSILGTVNLIFVLLALVFQNLGDAIVLPAIILTALALSTMLDFIFRSAIERRKEEMRAERQREKRETKVVKLPKSFG